MLRVLLNILKRNKPMTQNKPDIDVIEGWINIYPSGGFSFIYDLKMLADNIASPEPRIDCRKIRYTEGVGIEDVTDEWMHLIVEDLEEMRLNHNNSDENHDFINGYNALIDELIERERDSDD